MVLSASALSGALLDLYDAAQNLHITVFPRYALEIIKKFIDFDTAMIGLAKMGTDGHLTASYAFNYEEDAQINAEYLSIAHRDPITKSLFGSPGVVINFEAAKFITTHAERDIADYVRRRRHLHVLAIAPHYCPKHGNLGLSLRRADAKWVYKAAENRTLAMLMPHVREAFRINRALFSQQVALTSTEPLGGFCIFDAAGMIVYHDTPFEHFMRGVSPDFEGFKLPLRLRDVFCKQRQPCQALGHLLLQARWVGHFCFLSARPRNRLDALTPREQAVAQFYGTGLTYKEIGAELAISPATVRRHIEAVYAKLSIQNKADLAFLVQAHGEHQTTDKLLVKLAPTS